MSLWGDWSDWFRERRRQGTERLEREHDIAPDVTEEVSEHARVEELERVVRGRGGVS